MPYSQTCAPVRYTRMIRVARTCPGLSVFSEIMLQSSDYRTTVLLDLAISMGMIGYCRQVFRTKHDIHRCEQLIIELHSIGS